MLSMLNRSYSFQIMPYQFRITYLWDFTFTNPVLIAVQTTNPKIGCLRIPPICSTFCCQGLYNCFDPVSPGVAQHCISCMADIFVAAVTLFFND
mmetsp:Transcript_25514/g.32139  ORF Transcript_25514/g.32139 Transcript_25514/m.32139 type:complete len:94 (-) Transcript_25514:19-300(-)